MLFTTKYNLWTRYILWPPNKRLLSLSITQELDIYRTVPFPSKQTSHQEFMEKITEKIQKQITVSYTNSGKSKSVVQDACQT